jgi:hypothetical protein
MRNQQCDGRVRVPKSIGFESYLRLGRCVMGSVEREQEEEGLDTQSMPQFEIATRSKDMPLPLGFQAGAGSGSTESVEKAEAILLRAPYFENDAPLGHGGHPGAKAARHIPFAARQSLARFPALHRH